eukprot:11219274-Lingulodinium_polyedra.AAC.1
MSTSQVQNYGRREQNALKHPQVTPHVSVARLPGEEVRRAKTVGGHQQRRGNAGRPGRRHARGSGRLQR